MDSLAVTSGQSFCVVTILLAGPPADADATLQVLREASGKPLAFIFLGIGGADFRELEVPPRLPSKALQGLPVLACLPQPALQLPMHCCIPFKSRERPGVASRRSWCACTTATSRDSM